MLHVLYLQQTKTEDNQLNETKALQKVIRQANKKNESAKQSWIESTKKYPKKSTTNKNQKKQQKKQQEKQKPNQANKNQRTKYMK